MDGEKILYDCLLCRRPFQFGPHVYNGRHIAAWDAQICDRCVNSNWDGVVPETHPELVAHLKARSIPVRLNAKGWINIPPS
jgi:hypothetical protein